MGVTASELREGWTETTSPWNWAMETNHVWSFSPGEWIVTVLCGAGVGGDEKLLAEGKRADIPADRLSPGRDTEHWGHFSSQHSRDWGRGLQVWGSLAYIGRLCFQKCLFKRRSNVNKLSSVCSRWHLAHLTPQYRGQSAGWNVR